jgi:hypothetical protein
VIFAAVDWLRLTQGCTYFCFHRLHLVLLPPTGVDFHQVDLFLLPPTGVDFHLGDFCSCRLAQICGGREALIIITNVYRKKLIKKRKSGNLKQGISAGKEKQGKWVKLDGVTWSKHVNWFDVGRGYLRWPCSRSRCGNCRQLMLTLLAILRLPCSQVHSITHDNTV